MYRALIIASVIGIVFSSVIAPEREFSSKKVRQLDSSESLANSEKNNEPQSYPNSNQQQTNLPIVHFYPTYPEHSGKNSLSVQPTFDGYLIPIEPPRQSWTSSFISTLVPLSSYAISYGARAGALVWNLFLLLLIGGILTTSVCTLTPFCTITFLGLGLNRNQVREQVSELARTYITPESVNAATLLVKRAIDKYTELQRLQREEEERIRSEKKEERRRKR